MSPARRSRPKLEDLPALVTVPQIAAQLGQSQSFVLAHLEDRSGRETFLSVAGRRLKVHRHGKGWCAWRVDLAEFVGDKVA